MSFKNLFKNKVTKNLFVYKSYVHIKTEFGLIFHKTLDNQPKKQTRYETKLLSLN